MPETQVSGYETTYNILAEGSGAAVAKGATVTVHATGSADASGSGAEYKKFWSTKDPGQQPFTYQAGVGQVITGWDQGLLGMKVGERRQITIPGKEGYGPAGFPAWGIPPNATLRFELEVLSIK